MEEVSLERNNNLGMQRFSFGEGVSPNLKASNSLPRLYKKKIYIFTCTRVNATLKTEVQVSEKIYYF